MREKDLPLQLLWEVTRTTKPHKFLPDVRMPAVDQPHRHASIYAPSLSWTAWSESVHNPLPERVTSQLSQGWTACEVVELHVTVPGPSIYGQVFNAHIKLRGVLHPFEPIYLWVRSRESPKDDNQSSKHGIRSKGERPQVSLDVWRNEGWDRLFFFATLHHTNVQGGREVSGLILEKTAVEGTYRRVGIAIMLGVSWIGAKAQALVTII
jgi:hypothetical protein